MDKSEELKELEEIAKYYPKEHDYYYEITPDGKKVRRLSGPSFALIPEKVKVLTPICLACLLYDRETSRCDAYGERPKQYRQCKTYNCPHFNPDKKSECYKEVAESIEKEKQA